MNNTWKSCTRIVIVMPLLLITLAGCNSLPERDPAYAVTRPVAVAPAQYRNGSLYQPGYDITLFEDRRARRVGDILSITLNESTAASKEATTDLSKTTSINVTNPTILGTTPLLSVPGVLPLAATTGLGLGTSLGSNHSFAGEGSSEQKNNLIGTISVTVAEVLPNGYLLVKGEKIFSLNQGNEHIRLSGIVRPDDISSDNTVLSTKIADAVITYGGQGATNDTNVIGWLAKFFISALLPF